MVRRRTLPSRVYLYVTAVSVAALALSAVSAVVAGAFGGLETALEAVALAVMIAAANRQPLHVGPRRKVIASTAPAVAAVLLLPGLLAALTLAGGTVAGEAHVRARPVQRLFNTAVAVLSALAGSGARVVVLRLAPHVVREPAAALAAATALYVTGTLLVNGIAAVQLRENPLRRLLVPQRDLLAVEAALALTGIAAALASAAHAWALVLLVAPALLARRAVEEAEARYRGIFEHALEGIFQTAFDGRIRAANPAAARLLGYTSAAELIASVPELRQLYVDPARQDEYQQCIVTRGAVNNFELQLRRRDGSTIWVSLNARARRAADGRVISVEGMLTDVSERKRAEREREQLLQREQAARAAAEAASRAKDEFLSLLSHELRTPLTSILGFTQLLRRMQQPNPDTLAQGLEAIARGANVQARLIDDLLDVSRIVTGKLQIESELTDLQAVIEAAAATVLPAAEANGIQLTVDLDPAAGWVMGDPDRLQQVVWNLLTNAVKFTPRDGCVSLSLARAGGDAGITVADTGRGIDADFLPHVFERFQQADASTTRTYGGLGLGLAIVHRLVELHGGRVTAASAGEGQGATFTVRLPLARLPRLALEDSAPPAEPGSSSAASGILAGVRVLVAEDDADTRAFLRLTLESEGAAVTAVASTAEALSALAGARPDILLADISMPGEDGYSLIATVRSRGSEQGGALPAVALTAFAGSEDRRRALAAGFQRHLAKPIDPSAVVTALARLTGRALDVEDGSAPVVSPTVAVG